MANNDVNIAINAQGNNARSQFMSIVTAMNRMEDSLRRISHTSAQTAKKATQSFNRTKAAINGAKTAMQTFFGIGSAGGALLTTVQLLRSEMEAIKQVQGTMKTQEVSTGEAIERVYGQLPAGSDVTRGDLRDMALYNPSGLGMSEALDLMAAAMSAGEGDDARNRLQGASDTLGMIQQYPQEERLKIMEAARTSVDAFGGSVEARTAQMLSALSASPSATEVAPFMENMSSAVVSLRSLGLSFEESLSRFVTFQQGTRDTSGATSRTGVVQMESDIERKFTEYGISDKYEPDERMKFLQTNDPLANKIRKEMIGIYDSSLKEAERQLLAAGTNKEAMGDAQNRIKNLMTERRLLQRRDLIDPEDTAEPQNKFYENLNENIPSAKGASEVVQRRMEESRSDPATSAYFLEMEANRAARIINASPDAAAREQFAQFIEKQSVALGNTSLGTSLKAFAARVDTVESDLDEVYGDFVGLLQNERDKLQTYYPEIDGSRAGGPGFMIGDDGVRPKKPDEYTERDVQLIQGLESMIDVVGQMADNFKAASSAQPPAIRQEETASLLSAIIDDDKETQTGLRKATEAVWRAAGGYPDTEMGESGRAADVFQQVVRLQLEKALQRPLTRREDQRVEDLSSMFGERAGNEESLQDMLREVGAVISGEPSEPVKDPGRADVPGERAPQPVEGGEPRPRPAPGDGAQVTRKDNADVVAAVDRLSAQIARAMSGGQPTQIVPSPTLPASPMQGVSVGRPSRHTPPPINPGDVA